MKPREPSQIFLKLDYNYLLALNKQIDDQPEIRMIQRAAKKMTSEDLDKMMQILNLTFSEAFKRLLVVTRRMSSDKLLC